MVADLKDFQNILKDRIEIGNENLIPQWIKEETLHLIWIQYI